MRRASTWIAGAMLAIAIGSLVSGQASQHALRFYGTGTGQQDRVRIQVDDDGPGPDASAPCDVGEASFTLELWLRGTLADNPTQDGGGDVALGGDAWRTGNVLIDRDIWGSSAQDWGVSIAGGHVRFGTGTGDAGNDPSSTIEGDRHVLDGVWHHVALVRDASAGQKRIYVDGLLDYQGPTGVSDDNLSYPNGGVASSATPWGPYLVIAAEKHDAGPAHPSFAGYVDELRIWSVARTQAEILDAYDRVIAPGAPGLVGYYRFEEGGGTSVADASAAGSPDGQLIAGLPGNGQWVAFAQSSTNTAPVSDGILPWGFERTKLAGGFAELTTLEFLPDGRLLLAERDGTIWIRQGGTVLAQPLIQIPAATQNGERGLVGLARDPSFATNGYLYAYYTTLEPRNRVARFTVVGNSASPTSEAVIWQNPDLAQNFHHGGAIRFGPDGHLYIATGDQFVSANSQLLTNQHGKLLRVTSTGAIPPGNPFVGVPGAQPPIWAYGLRNPFRFVFDELTGAMWIGDVGSNSPTAWEELNRGQAGANYGWQDQEGLACYVSSCAGYAPPAHVYHHSDTDYVPIPPQAAIIGGPVYRASSFPETYRGNLFFGDYANGWIRRLVFDSAGNPAGDPLFLQTPQAGTIVDFEVGPDGALHYVTVGVLWSGSVDDSALWRIAYVGGGNQAPIAVASAAPTSGLAPLAVSFSSAGSADPDGGPSSLSFAWAFGDGATSAQPNPQHTYAATGQYAAALTVSDGAATTAAAPIAITVGNAPIAAIAAPAAGSIYEAGDLIQFAGNATDAEDGVLPASAFSWLVVLVHSAHTHPFLGPIAGVKQGSFQIPTSGHSPEDTHYEIRLTVQDSSGLAGTASVSIAPHASVLVLDTVPSGIPIFLDGQAEATPRVVESLVGYQHVVQAQSSFVLAGADHDFGCWSDGLAQTHSVVAPSGGMNLTANYDAAGGGALDLPVPAANRNAEHWPPAGQGYGNFYDPLGLCFGRDGGGPSQTGLEFALAVPQGATIVSAAVQMTATHDQAGTPRISLRAYDVASAPPFAAGSPIALTSWAPLTAASVTWDPPAFAPGASYATPSLAALVQEVVDRPDWLPGNHLGLVLDGSPSTGDEWRCLRNFASGQSPRLQVVYSSGAGGGACAGACGFTTYSLAAAPANVLGLYGTGSPKLGGSLALHANELGAAPGAWFAGSASTLSIPLLGGVLLVNPAQQFLLVFRPKVGGEAVWTYSIGTGPSLAGSKVYFQAAALAPTQPQGFAFSAGLEIEICP